MLAQRKGGMHASKGGRKRENVWQFYSEESIQSSKSRRVLCQFCGESVIAQSDRMRYHIDKVPSVGDPYVA